MGASRRVVIFFMALGMLGWGVLLVDWTMGLIVLALQVHYAEGPNQKLHLNLIADLSGYGWCCAVLGYLAAWCCLKWNVRWLNVIIAVLGLAALVLDLTARVMDPQLRIDLVSDGMYVLLGMPLIVAGGFTFLRVTRNHPSLTNADAAGEAWREQAKSICFPLTLSCEDGSVELFMDVGDLQCNLEDYHSGSPGWEESSLTDARGREVYLEMTTTWIREMRLK